MEERFDTIEGQFERSYPELKKGTDLYNIMFARWLRNQLEMLKKYRTFLLSNTTIDFNSPHTVEWVEDVYQSVYNREDGMRIVTKNPDGFERDNITQGIVSPTRRKKSIIINALDDDYNLTSMEKIIIDDLITQNVRSDAKYTKLLKMYKEAGVPITIGLCTSKNDDNYAYKVNRFTTFADRFGIDAICEEKVDASNHYLMLRTKRK